MVYFISGHRNFTEEEFNTYYIPKLKEAIKDKNYKFVIGDYWGVDEMAQVWLSKNLPEKEHYRVTIYHMFNKPRICCSNKFLLSGGYKTDIERDSAMTDASNVDIAFIHSGRWDSGTAQNILRRFEVRGNYNIIRFDEVLKSVKGDYKSNDLCMVEILANTLANGLTLEEAHKLYIELLNWSDGDEFFRKLGTSESIEKE